MECFQVPADIYLGLRTHQMCCPSAVWKLLQQISLLSKKGKKKFIKTTEPVYLCFEKYQTSAKFVQYT